MSNTSYLTANRQGTRAGVADGSVRICVTLKEATFNALRDRAAGRGHTLSGEAALLIEKLLSPPTVVSTNRVPETNNNNESAHERTLDRSQ